MGQQEEETDHIYMFLAFYIIYVLFIIIHYLYDDGASCMTPSLRL